MKIGIKGYNSFVETTEHIQELELKLHVRVKAHEYAVFLDEFLKDFQEFLNERK